jgi:hypothetical protein
LLLKLLKTETKTKLYYDRSLVGPIWDPGPDFYY